MNPPMCGAYVLIAHAVHPAHVAVGRFGDLSLDAGFVAYVGSALGSGGLRARIGRHLDATRPLHWHIDYLKRAAHIVEIWYVVDPVRREHAWANALAGLPNASIPMRGFGSSDCRCPAHLFHFATAPTVATFRRALVGTPGAGEEPVRVFRPPRNGLAAAMRRRLPG